MPIKRPVKMLLYAAPGTGKSVFASRFPKPFFICTDGNYEWLLDFGAKEEDHVNISSFAEFEKLAQNDFAGYDTIVVDLLEDIYKWNEYEFCKKQKVDHLSDAGGYGKGWDITRTRLFVACSKLLALPKNVIFLSHESSYTKKDRKGNETTMYTPSNLMSDKFMVMLEGRLRYVLRAKFADEVTEDGKVIMHRVLSLVPKTDEYGIIRGVNTDLMPEDIDLDANTFLQVVGYTPNDAVEQKKPVDAKPAEAKPAEAKPAEAKLVETVQASGQASVQAPIQEPVQEAKPVDDKAAKLAALRAKLNKPAEPKPEPKPAEPEPEPIKEAPVPEPEKVTVIEEKVEPVVEPAQAQEQPESQEDKIARIKAKLAAKARK